MAESILVVDNVTKTYPGVKALDQVSLEFRKGEIHALVGENGAGKSTIIKTIAGAIKPDSGSVRWERSDTDEDQRDPRLWNRGCVSGIQSGAAVAGV